MTDKCVNEMSKAGFEHPCKETCSGWEQGYERGQSDERKRAANLIAAIEDLRNEFNCYSTGISTLMEDDVKECEERFQYYLSWYQEGGG